MSLAQPDLGVLRKAQRGDERAFSLIVRAYEVPVYNYVLRLVGDRSLAEDLTQEVFLRVYQGLPRFSLRCRFTTWLFQVTKNRVLDELRANERRPRAVADEPQHVVEDWELVRANDERESSLISSLSLPQDAEIRLRQRQVGVSIAAKSRGSHCFTFS